MTQKKRRMWGGFVGGRLDWYPTPRQPAVFFTKVEAKLSYTDVRPLALSWSTPPKRKRKARHGT